MNTSNFTSWKQKTKNGNQANTIRFSTGSPERENIEAVISSIMQNVLKIMAVSMEELPDDI